LLQVDRVKLTIAVWFDLDWFAVLKTANQTKPRGLKEK
jgi:hypothetical protein